MIPAKIPFANLPISGSSGVKSEATPILTRATSPPFAEIDFKPHKISKPKIQKTQIQVLASAMPEF